MERGFLNYIKNAFFLRWNLLALGAGVAAGIISGSPDVVIPLVAAAEILYLASLSTNHRFQSAIDASVHKRNRENEIRHAQGKFQQMVSELSLADRRNFELLKTQCIDLRRLSDKLKDGTSLASDVLPAGMNRLLWIYLKLLYSKNAVEKFFATIDKNLIHSDMANARKRLEMLGPVENDTPNDSRRRVSLEDQLNTCQARIDNYRRAEENYEFIKDELNRLSTKIASLAELAINRQDPDYITSEVDSVSDSVASSEKAMGELDFLTGLATREDYTPDMFETSEMTELAE